MHPHFGYRRNQSPGEKFLLHKGPVEDPVEHPVEELVALLHQGHEW